jgi:predicted CopG family antitoxin
MANKSKTTILIEKEIANELKKCKQYSRETYDEVLKRLLKKKKEGVLG